MSFGTLLNTCALITLFQTCLDTLYKKSEQFFAHFRVWQLAYSGLIDRFCQRASSQTKHESEAPILHKVDRRTSNFFTGKRQKERLLFLLLSTWVYIKGGNNHDKTLLVFWKKKEKCWLWTVKNSNLSDNLFLSSFTTFAPRFRIFSLKWKR